MRDRGAPTATPEREAASRTLVKLFTAFVAVPVTLVLATAGYASADTAGSGQVPFSVAGPVGVAAVVVGIGGVVVGLFRRRKLTSRAVPMAAKAQQAVTNALTTPMERVVADERAA